MSSDQDLLPFEPIASDPFDRVKAAHLLRRAGFSGTEAQVAELASLGPAGAVRALTQAAPGELADVLELERDVAARASIERVRAWWVLRMTQAAAPLRERLALFWHGHFATSNRKVARPAWMLDQLGVFWRLGAGRFQPLVLAVSRDPAMIRWLDNDSNTKGRPNENFARELFELFTLGRGSFGEGDVKEAARAFTGWGIARNAFSFDGSRHDAGEKTVLGVSGNLGGEDVVATALSTDACPRFLARKLLAFFVQPEPAEVHVAALAARLRASDLHIGEAVDTILRSRLFFSRGVWRTKVKSPVDFVVGAVRALGLEVAPMHAARSIGRLGQELLEPPSVAGWEGERSWVSSSSWILRSNFAAELCAAGRIDPKVFPSGPRDLVEAVVARLLDGEVSPGSRERLLAFAAEGGSPAERLSGVLHAAMTLPEYHLL